MREKIFQDRVTFNIVYNESVNENMKKNWTQYFLQSSEKNVYIFKTEIKVCETALCHDTFI